ncbi:MAG TPA: SIS domain-containing protein [Xanthobacteraceae bacterium]|nr:SIS domain-containing protein [Xanthobacteraceae bacterium]
MTDIQRKIRRVLEAEAQAILAVPVDQAFERAVLQIERCPGKIVTTGMGKAGLTARKFAAVLCSTGTPAVFIHPGEAAHGDLGLVAGGDCIVAFSNSGKTREVIELIHLARQLGCDSVIGVTSHPDSELRALSNVLLDMGRVVEPCPLGLTPTASVAVMSAISDALAIVIMERKGFTAAEYGIRHHGGYLGSRARNGAAPGAKREKSETTA